MAGQAHSHDNHAHGHDSCGGHGHSHAPKVTHHNRRRVGIAALLTGLFMVAEVVGGLVSGSLALLADAGHMMMDFAALAMAWVAFQIARKPANANYSFGYDRFPVLIAFVNGLTLFLLSGWIIWEAVQRFITPGDILAGPMLYIAIAGLVVNLIVFKILSGADQHNLNVRGAMLHVLGDLLGSVAAIAAAVIILMTGWTLADPILSILVACLILRSAYGLIKASAHVLMQGTPHKIDIEAIRTDLLQAIPDISSISDLHIWSLTNDDVVLTLKATLCADASIVAQTEKVRARLLEAFSIETATIEMIRQD